MTIYWGRFHKGLIREQACWEETLERTLWGNYSPGKLISIPYWGIINVLDGDWASTIGHWVLVCSMYACFVWMHVRSLNPCSWGFDFYVRSLILTYAMRLMIFIGLMHDVFWSDAWPTCHFLRWWARWNTWLMHVTVFLVKWDMDFMGAKIRGIVCRTSDPP